MPFSITSISKSSQNVGGTLDDGSPTKWSVNGTCVCGYGANMNWMYWIDTRKNPYANALKDHEHQLGWVPRCNKCKRGMDPKLFPPISEEFAMKLLTDIFEHDITLQESFVGEGERLHKVRITPPPPAGECGNDEIGIGDKLTCQVWVIKGLGITYEQPIQLVEPLPIASQKATANEPAIVKEIAGPEGLPTVSQYVPCGLPFPDKDGKMTLPVMGDNPLPIEIVYWEKGDGWDATNFGQMGCGTLSKEWCLDCISSCPVIEQTEKTMNEEKFEQNVSAFRPAITYTDWNRSIESLIQERKMMGVSVDMIKKELAWKWMHEYLMSDGYKAPDAITNGNGLLTVSVSDDYRVEWHNDTILVDSRKGLVRISMPDPTIGTKAFVIKDLGGMAGVNNIVISYWDKVSGFSSGGGYLTKTYTLMENYESVVIRSDGQRWIVDGQETIADYMTTSTPKNEDKRTAEIRSETVLMEKAKIVINGDMKVMGDLEIRNCEIVIDGGKLDVVGNTSIMNSTIDGSVDVKCNGNLALMNNVIGMENGDTKEIDWKVSEQKDELHILVDSNGLTRIKVGDKQVGYIQRVKFEADANTIVPTIEVVFPDFGEWQPKEVAENAALLEKFPQVKIVYEPQGKSEVPKIAEDTDWSFVFFATIGSLVGSFVSKIATDGKMNVRVAEDGLTGLDEMVSVDGSAGENSL